MKSVASALRYSLEVAGVGSIPAIILVIIIIVIVMGLLSGGARNK